MTIRYYYGDSDELEGMTRAEVEEVTCSEYEREDYMEQALDDMYPAIEIGDLTFLAGDILRNCDPIAFRCVVSDSFEEVYLDEYPEDDDED